MATLLLLWKRRAEVAAGAAVVLALLLWGALKHIQALNAQIAAKPKVESKTEETSSRRSSSREDRGRVRETVKYVTVPGSCEPQIVERVIEHAPVTIVKEVEKVVEKEVEKVSAPVGLPARPPRWILGYQLELGQAKVPGMPRAGVSIGGRLDLTYGFHIDRKTHHGDIAIRF